MVNRYSVEQLNHLSEKREVWCWGCGFRFGLMINEYSQEPFLKRAVGLIDSNEKNQNKTRKIGNKDVLIYSPIVIKSKGKKILLIISSDAVKEIYNFAKEIYQDMDVIYSLYPTVYYNKSNWIKKICCKLPFRRSILFYVGSNNSQPHENADAIQKYIEEEYKGKKYKIVYLSDYPCDMPIGVKQISLSDIRNKANLFKIVRYYYWYSVSKYIMYESTAIDKIRKNQLKIYLNHGTIPLKKVSDVLAQPEDLSYAVCPGEGCAKFYVEQYAVPYEKLIFAMPPRVNQIFVDACEKVDTVLNSKDKQLILWLPTFRKLERGDKSERRDSSVENPIITLLQSSDMKVLQDRLEKNNQVLVFKCHPREKEEFENKNRYKNVIVISDCELIEKGMNTHQLMNRANAMISDYSGVTFEYMLLDREIGYFIPDYDEYSRGFSVDNALDYMPGIKMRNVDELLYFLDELKNGSDRFKNQRNQLKEKLFGNVDAKSGAKDLLQFLDGEK